MITRLPAIARRARPLALIAAAFFGAAALAGCAADEGAAAGADALTLAPRGAGNPTLALSTDGRAAYVAWAGAEPGDSGAIDIYLARVTAAGAAGAPVRVNHVPGEGSIHESAPPQVALGPGGEVYVVWERPYAVAGRRFNATDLRFARSTDGGQSFEPATFVNDDAGGLPASHTFHNVAVGRDGTIYVSWIDTRTKDRSRAERAATGAPAAEHAMAGHGGHGAGDADAGLPGSELWIARSTDGGRSFSPGVVVDRDICPCCRTGLAVGPDGAVYVVWRKIFDGDVRDVAIARSSDGGRSFSAPAPVHRDGWVFPGCPHAGPSIALTDDGRVHVAWYTGREGAQGLYYAASADGGRTFGTPLALVADEWVPPSHVRLAARGNEVRAAWDDRREPKDERRVRLARLKGHAVEPLPVRTPLLGAAPDLALTGAFGAIAWQQGDAVQLRFLEDR